MSHISIWNYEDYKAFLNDFFQTLPNKGRGQYKQLSEKLNVHPTLISQILNGEKNFSYEQAIGVARFSSLNENETEYFFELLSFAKSGTTDLRKFHYKRMLKLVANSKSVKTRVGKSVELTEEDKIKYYSDWTYIAVWLATSIDEVKDEVGLANILKMSLEEVKRIIDFLIDKGLCKRSVKGLEMGIQKTHIPADSPLVKNHHLNWRIKGVDFVRNLSSDELAFTAPFSVSKKDFQLIKDKILNLIEEISQIVNESDAEIVACLNIDQFIVAK